MALIFEDDRNRSFSIEKKKFTIENIDNDGDFQFGIMDAYSDEVYYYISIKQAREIIGFLKNQIDEYYDREENKI